MLLESIHLTGYLMHSIHSPFTICSAYLRVGERLSLFAYPNTHTHGALSTISPTAQSVLVRGLSV